MWPFDMVPKEQIQKDHGVTLTDAWLDHVRLSSVRFSVGGSGSFVSATGLVLTNHHVASDCISKLASQQKDYLGTGFLAGPDGPEAKCPDLELNQLVSIEDVTDTVRAAKIAGMSDADANAAMKGAMARIEKACTDKGVSASGALEAPHATGVTRRCDVVTLYAGGKYHLYSYNKYTDVRLVFAPEQSIAFFGGDPDNFTYPRYDLDLAIFRVYTEDKPLAAKDFLKWNADGPKDGDTVFVSGHPGSTDRMDTTAQLARLRDLVYPYYLDQAARERGALRTLAHANAEGARESRAPLFRIENGIKAVTGYEAGLENPALMKKQADREAALRKAIAADPKMQSEYGPAFADVERAQKAVDALYRPYAAIERASRSDLFQIARSLVRLPRELATPNERRLKEYRDSNLDSLKIQLFSTAPIYGAVEVALIRTWLDRMVRDLGADDETVKAVLDGRSTERTARELVAGTRLTDLNARRALYDAGAIGIDASSDPMVKLLVLLDRPARAIRKRYEDEVEGPMRQAGQKIAQAVFAVRGTSVYPDATFTLRLSPGVVTGYSERGKAIAWATDFAGLYAHATGTEPRKLPKRWLDASATVNSKTPLDFVSTNDIIGGNSGSPVVSASGDLVGLVFDGNLSSLPNRFVYGETTERAVSVDTAGMLEALAHVYGAGALVSELLAAPAPARAAQ
jgi:hypothetical protein